MWRIVPYDEAMYNEKNQPKHVFEYVASSPSFDEKTGSSNTLQLGYEFVPYKNEFKNSAIQKVG